MAATAAHLVPGDVAAWRDRIRAFAAEGRKPVIGGAGSKAVSLLTTCGLDREVEYLVDVNPHKAGKFLPGTGTQLSNPSFCASITRCGRRDESSLRRRNSRSARGIERHG
jgi:hypothetical protein